ncbi:MAG: circularly permuted type 2 ATP-grasp protein [Solirubrobacterales bacterium]
MIDGAEWARVEAGLVQRARALDAFVRDAYGDLRIFAEGIVPERVLRGGPTYESAALEFPVRPRVHVVGFDLARRADGEMVVLEDNLRTPSGAAYVLAAREAVWEEIHGDGLAPRPVDETPGLLADTLRHAAPAGVHEPRIVVASDGESSTAWWEHRTLAAAVGATAVTLDRLETAAGRLWLRGDGGREPVDVLYRRTDDPRLRADDGSLTPLGELTVEPLRAGTLAVVNAFGAGVGDDKLSYAYTEKMIRFYLDEDPLLRAIPTYDPCVPEQRDEALERLDELVVKPRFESGGEGVLIVGEADPPETIEAEEEIRRSPEDLVIQERISMSTHPCLSGERLEPRRIDLRPFAYATSEGFRIVPGGLTRFAPDPESMIVNSSQGGGAKDTWVLSDG